MNFLQNLISHFLPERLELYSDGSFKNGWGAWAYVLVRNGRVIAEDAGRVRRTTSLRMEMQALIEGLATLSMGTSVRVHTDCRSIIDRFVRSAKIRAGSPNSDLLEQLSSLNGVHQIEWCWVRGHSGNPYNERCDTLCKIHRGN